MSKETNQAQQAHGQQPDSKGTTQIPCVCGCGCTPPLKDNKAK